MSFFRDRFLIAVVAITVVTIAGMAIFRSAIVMKPVSKNKVIVTSTVPVQPEPKPTSYDSQPLGRKGPLKVVRVIDGDTFVLDDGETVRLIGIDAPETHHAEVPVQRFGEEATEFLRRMVEGFEVALEYEPNEMHDSYGRLLVYAYIGDRMVNAEMIRRGYAYAYTRFPFRRLDEFVKLEEEARQKQYGLWFLSLRDGRIANLVHRYESLSIEGRKKLDEILDTLIKEYPFEKKEGVQ